jgi:hypothetical protein
MEFKTVPIECLKALEGSVRGGVSYAVAHYKYIPIFIFLHLWKSQHQGIKETTYILQEDGLTKIFVQYQEEILAQDKNRRDHKGWLCLSYNKNRSWIEFCIGVNPNRSTRRFVLSAINDVLSAAGNRDWYLPADMFKADATRATETQIMAVLRTIPKTLPVVQ